MSEKSSTLRSVGFSSTQHCAENDPVVQLEAKMRADWQQRGKPDLRTFLLHHPDLLQHKSLLLDFVVEEFKSSAAKGHQVDVPTFCARFRQFGGPLESLIKRELEVEDYVAQHPELLESLTAAWPVVGDRFADFEIIEELGRGATAHVYLCSEPKLGDRLTVVKATVDLGFEATILGRLDHPSIIPIYSQGYDSVFGLHYICMPYCGRSTLLDLIACAFESGCPRDDSPLSIAANRWALPLQQPEINHRRAIKGTYIGAILKLASQIAEGLVHAHRRKILHGDLKPSNILLSPSGRSYILDFNLSKDFARSLTTCGGTLAYMPPEYLAVIAGQQSPSTTADFSAAPDVYSFGAVLFELLTGQQRVTPARNLDIKSACGTLLEDLQKSTASVRKQNPLVSKNLEGIVQRCVSFSPEDRYRDLTQVIRLLTRERRSWRAMTRFARVRPIVSGFALGIPILIGTAGSAYVATRPPLFESQYSEGLNQRRSGNLESALDCFVSAAAANPDFFEARFQAGLTCLEMGRFDVAIKYLSELAQKYDAVTCMGYVGYAFNRKGMAVAAIPWYERAVAHGGATLPILNNLAASLLTSPGPYSVKERFVLVDRYLRQACAIDPTCNTVRLNQLRLAILRASEDPSFKASDAADHAIALLDQAGDDLYVRDLIAMWSAVAGYDVNELKSADPRWRAIAEINAETLARGQNQQAARSTLSGLEAERHFYLRPVEETAGP